MTRKPDSISQEAWDAVTSPELTERMLDGMRPAREALRPALFEKLTKGRGPQKTPTKEAVSLRLDRDVLNHFRAKGRGWQTEVNDVLRQSAKAEAKAAKTERTAPVGFKNKPKTVAELASRGLKNPASLSSKEVKNVAASTLTQRSGLSPATRRDKKRSK